METLKDFFLNLITDQDAIRLMTPDIYGKFPLTYDMIMVTPVKSAPGTVNHSDKFLCGIAEEMNSLTAVQAKEFAEFLFDQNSTILIGVKTGDRIVRT